MDGCCNCSCTKFSTSPAWAFYCVFSWIVVLTDEIIHAYCEWLGALTILRMRKYFTNEREETDRRTENDDYQEAVGCLERFRASKILKIRKYFTKNNEDIDVSKENDDDNHEEVGTLEQYLKLDRTAELNPGHNFKPENVVQPVLVNIKTEIARWYETKWFSIPRKLLILSVENTIQFSYQYSTLLFHHVYTNLRDFDEDRNIFFTVAVVRSFSIFLSTFSIISPIMDRMTILSYIHGAELSGISVAIKCIQIISHLCISTGISLLFGLEILQPGSSF